MKNSISQLYGINSRMKYLWRSSFHRKVHFKVYLKLHFFTSYISNSYIVIILSLQSASLYISTILSRIMKWNAMELLIKGDAGDDDLGIFRKCTSKWFCVLFHYFPKYVRVDRVLSVSTKIEQMTLKGRHQKSQGQYVWVTRMKLLWALFQAP